MVEDLYLRFKVFFLQYLFENHGNITCICGKCYIIQVLYNPQP